MLKGIKEEKNIEFASVINYDKMIASLGNNIRLTNAVILNTALGYDDDDRLFSLQLHFNNCSFGHQYCLTNEYFSLDAFDRRKYLFDIGSVIGMTFIMRVMEVVGVKRWEDVKNKYVRCVFSNEEEQVSSRLLGIGHIVDDKFLIPNLFFKTVF